MSSLFIELYLDEDVDVLVAELIRARGFVATTSIEAGQFRKSDAEMTTAPSVSPLLYKTAQSSIFLAPLRCNQYHRGCDRH